jgi:hypothetical protein
VAQRDSEPNNNTALTNLWQVGETVQDNHAILLPSHLSTGDYRLIVGMYDINDASARLLTEDGADFVEVATLSLR